MISVYHCTFPANREDFRRNGTVLHRWAREYPQLFKAAMGYAFVAAVDTNDLNTAYSETNHIDWEWWFNTTIMQYDISRSMRSSDIGDLLVTENGDEYVVAPIGFIKLGEGVYNEEA